MESGALVRIGRNVTENVRREIRTTVISRARKLMYALEHYGELDQEYRKRQMRKWRTFVAMCSLTAASLLGCVGFKVGETMTTKSSYEGYIKEAAKLAGTK